MGFENIFGKQQFLNIIYPKVLIGPSGQIFVTGFIYKVAQETSSQLVPMSLSDFKSTFPGYRKDIGVNILCNLDGQVRSRFHSDYYFARLPGAGSIPNFSEFTKIIELASQSFPKDWFYSSKPKILQREIIFFDNNRNHFFTQAGSIEPRDAQNKLVTLATNAPLIICTTDRSPLNGVPSISVNEDIFIFFKSIFSQQKKGRSDPPIYDVPENHLPTLPMKEDVQERNQDYLKYPHMHIKAIVAYLHPRITWETFCSEKGLSPTSPFYYLKERTLVDSVIYGFAMENSMDLDLTSTRVSSFISSITK